jgi:hypothetical protein
MGILPIAAYVVRVHLHVTVAFTSDGTDNISVGYSGTLAAYATNTDSSSTGVKTVTLGANIGYQTTAREVIATYTNGGSEPGAGRGLVILEYFLAPVQP